MDLLVIIQSLAGIMNSQKAVCLSMDAGDRNGLYRFSMDSIVFYVEAHEDAALDDADYGFPPAILKLLPPRPLACNWADIRKNNWDWRFSDIHPIKFSFEFSCVMWVQTHSAVLP